MKSLETMESQNQLSESILLSLAGGQNSHNLNSSSEEKEFIQEQGSKASSESSKLPTYRISKQTDLEKRVDDWIAGKANQMIDDAEYQDGETLDWDLVCEYAVDQLKANFDKVDEESELIQVCKEDEPKAWQAQKLLILNYLKTL